MFTKDRFIFLIIIILSTVFLDKNNLYANQLTRNVNVKTNKTEIIWRHWIVNTQFDRTKVKCIVYRPPRADLKVSDSF